MYYISTEKSKYVFHIIRYKKSLCYLASDSFGVSLLVGTSNLTTVGASVSSRLPLSSAGKSSDMVASINIIYSILHGNYISHTYIYIHIYLVYFT